MYFREHLVFVCLYLFYLLIMNKYMINVLKVEWPIFSNYSFCEFVYITYGLHYVNHSSKQFRRWLNIHGVHCYLPRI